MPKANPKTSKKTWGAKPQPVAPDKVDALVRSKKAKGPVEKRRLSIDIPAELHTRIKVQCAQAKRDMTEAIVQILDLNF